MKIIENLFNGRDKALYQSIQIYQSNQRLIYELEKVPEYREALREMQPHFTYEDIVKTLRKKCPELEFNDAKQFSIVKDLIPMYRDVRSLGGTARGGVRMSKMTPMMIKKRIEEGYSDMPYEEFDRLQQLLTLDAKLKTLKLST